MNKALICPYCSGKSTPYLATRDINRCVSPQLYHLSRCCDCGLIFVCDPPDDLAPYYTVDYHFKPEDSAALEPHLEGQRFKIDLVRKFKQAGELLEIGPSTGFFCRLAQKAGFNVSAIEMDADCATFLHDKLGVRAINSADPAQILTDDPHEYDAICLWHSLEHINAPWLVLEQAIKRLRPDGLLVVAVPNPYSWQARLMGPRWAHFDLPRHLYQLPIPWLVTFTGQHGLVPELVTTRDEGSLYWNRFSWGMLLRSLSQHPRLRSYLWRLGMMVGRLLEPWEGQEGRGAAYTAIFRRKA